MNAFKIGDRVHFWNFNILHSAIITSLDIEEYPNFFNLYKTKKDAVNAQIKKTEEELEDLYQILKDCDNWV